MVIDGRRLYKRSNITRILRYSTCGIHTQFGPQDCCTRFSCCLKQNQRKPVMKERPGNEFPGQISHTPVLNRLEAVLGRFYNLRRGVSIPQSWPKGSERRQPLHPGRLSLLHQVLAGVREAVELLLEHRDPRLDLREAGGAHWAPTALGAARR